ncbi:MAG: gliding motility-associated C-terminal domain-containing protein [Spirosomataceae bacterium]
MKPFVTFLFFCLVIAAHGSHVAGGHLEMLALDQQPGRYKITLKIYIDETNFDPSSQNPGSYGVAILRRSDNKEMISVSLDRESTIPLSFVNQACATQRKLRFLEQTYTNTFTFKPEDYADPGGYYLVSAVCCRNLDLNNILEPGNTGQVFYAIFPPLLADGKPFLNSSPQFDPLTSEYICINTPFTYPFGATDADGDELRYSLVTPWSGYVKDGNSYVIPATAYPPVQWAPGFSEGNQLPGNPPLRINAQTGVLSVTANQLGLFCFGVQVEEYRNGVRIGLVRREYQLLVIDCPPTIPPETPITVENYPLNTPEVTICEGKTVQLTAIQDATWQYQWLRNDKVITGASSNSLSVNQPGTYTLVTSLKNECSRSRKSQSVTLVVNSSGFQLQTSSSILCPDSTATLNALSGAGLQYTWYKNGQKITTTTQPTWTSKEAGNYSVVAVNAQNGCIFRSDTVSLRQITLPPVTVKIEGASKFCRGDSAKLVAEPANFSNYAWHYRQQALQKSASSTYFAKEAGEYYLTVTDANGCVKNTAPVQVDTIAKIQLSFDSIPPFCGIDQKPVLLKATPANGSFSGAGVENNSFHPKAAGAGTHLLTYRITGTSDCRSGSITRQAVVIPIVTPNLPTEIEVWRGGSVQLNADIGPGFSYTWSPPAFIDDVRSSKPKVSPDANTQYQVRISGGYGCEISSSVKIIIKQKIWIPDVFTPNGDGNNDTWDLKGLEDYPDVEITVFNRWGEVIFYSKGYQKPFDGLRDGKPLPEGIYAYKLSTNSEPGSISVYETRGSILLLR